MAVINAGKIYLVGAGPGDPGLITLRGVECLRKADLVLYDYLVNPRILDHAERAETKCLGRHGAGRLMTIDEIGAAMVEAARAGRTVVRLKAGDPAVFARVAEEIAAIEAAGLEYEIVPGITAALATGSYAGVYLTHRDQASAVALVTGQEQSKKNGPGLDYEALARFPGTLVFYMGVTSAPRWTKALLEHGKAPDTPAAIIRRCSWPDQRTWTCRLDEVASTIANERLRPPMIVIVGDAAAGKAAATWFTRRPLFGKNMLVTRPIEQADELRAPLEELGANVYVQPAIEIGEPSDWAPVDRAIERLAEFDWVVFSSANGVRYFLDRLNAKGRDARAFGRARIAVIGPATAEALLGRGLRADLTPESYRAEALAEALSDGATGKRFLLIRASRGREVLAETLRSAGGIVEQVVAYESRDVAEADPEILNALGEGTIDWTLVTSSAIARSLARLFGEALRRTKLASISPITSGVLRDLGYDVQAEATEYTMAGLIDAVVAAESESADRAAKAE